jgi:hypothetical protein
VYLEGTMARRIRLNGEWLPGLSGARAYPSFEVLLNVTPQPPINPHRPLVWSLDFNVEPMCSIVGQREGPVFRVMREIYLEEGSTKDCIDAFYNIMPPVYSEIWIYGDATSSRRVSQTGISDYTLIQNELRQYRLSSRLKVPEANPRIADRINAVNLAANERGTANLSVDPVCTVLIGDMEQVLRTADGSIKKVKNKKDPYFKRTHMSDALGYWIAYEAPVRLLGEPSRRGREPLRIRTPVYNRRPSLWNME